MPLTVIGVLPGLTTISSLEAVVSDRRQTESKVSAQGNAIAGVPQIDCRISLPGWRGEARGAVVEIDGETTGGVSKIAAEQVGGVAQKNRTAQATAA